MSDEIVWQIINQQFCAYKLKTEKGNFCRNEYSVTGLCNRQSCPLANSRYATVRTSPKGTIYLYIKTIERAHMPAKWWEKIKLSKNYQTALQQIEGHLQYFPKFLLHKCKQRLTRLVQVATRMRKVAAEEARLGEQLVPKMAPKIKHREEARERKALAAAKLERTIERELLERLRQGAYGDMPLNCDAKIWQKVLNALEAEGEGSRDKDMDKGIEDEDAESEEELEQELEEEDEEEDGAVEYVSDIDESDEELADLEDWLGSEDDEEDDDDEEDSEEDDEEEVKKKTKAGDKRKKGRAVKPTARKRREMEVERETERSKLLAF